MAKQRMVQTKFWSDNWVIDHLNALEKLAFIYLITNSYTNISGMYELSLKIMAVETGIDKDNLEKIILPKLQKDGKIVYADGWVYIINFRKHQIQNPDVKKGIEREMSQIPANIKQKLQGVDTLPPDCIDPVGNSNLTYTKPNSNLTYTKPNLDFNLDSNIYIGDNFKKLSSPSQVMKEFLKQEDFYQDIISGLIKKGFNQELLTQEIGKFIDYWTELNKSGTKQRWELEKTFELERRLKTWLNNANKYNQFNKSKTIQSL